MNDEIRLKFRPVADVVMEILSEVGDPSGQLTAYKVSNLVRSTLEQLKLWIIPSFATIQRTVKSNGTIDMPNDCVRPLTVYRIHEFSGKNILLPYGRHKTLKPYTGFTCADPDEVNPNTAKTLGDILGNNIEFYTWHPEYLESYGSHTSRFFGFWTYHADLQFIEFSNAQADTDFIIRYHSDNDVYKHIPVDAVSMVVNKVLQRYWASSDVQKANYYFQQFRVEIRMFRKFRTDGYSLEDWADAITSEYSAINR